MTTWRTALRFALRDLRGGFHGFKVMLACLALGVAAIAGIGSLTAAVRDGLARDARVLLGGDLDIRVSQRPAEKQAVDWFRNHATVSSVVTMRTMGARTGAALKRVLIELKAVDRAYPLMGAVVLAPAMTLEKALQRDDEGLYGAAVERTLLGRLDLRLGDRLRIGLRDFVIRAEIRDEPDKASGAFRLGPRVFISAAALDATNLIQPGTLARWHYRLKYPPGTDGEALEERLDEAFPQTPWRIRNAGEATPRIQRHINRAALFFTLVGLTALLVGGIGVAGAVQGHLENKRGTIATLKCLGAGSRFIFMVFGTEIAIMAAGGVLIGLALGMLVPLALAPLLATYLPSTPGFSLHPAALAAAAAYGVAVAALFTLWPLARARQIPAAALFRGLVADPRFRPGAGTWAALTVAFIAVAVLALATAYRPSFAAWFILGAVLAFGIFAATGKAVRKLATLWGARLAKSRGSSPRLKLALANIARPGTPTGAIVMALGIGLTVFVALVQIEGNFQRQIASRIPDQAPAYFFIDIQPGQLKGFLDTVTAVPGTGEINRLPSLRGRISAVNGTPIDRIDVGHGARWAVQSDRGVTYAAVPPGNAEIVSGDWWPPDYAGPPLMSIDVRIAEGLGIGLGDTVTLNVLGREITARIANTRRIDWSQLGLNFTMIFSPGLLEAAPQTFIATVKAPRESEEALARAVLDRFANVTAVRVREALDAVADALGKIGMAARATAGLALISGVLVLAGAIAGGRRERTRDAVILKITGTRRRDLAIAYVIEYGLTGLAAALVAAGVGTVAAFLILTRIMEADWVFLPIPALITVVGAAFAVIGFGFAGTWRALAARAAPVLRASAGG